MANIKFALSDGSVECHFASGSLVIDDHVGVAYEVIN